MTHCIGIHAEMQCANWDSVFSVDDLPGLSLLPSRVYCPWWTV